LKTGIINKNGVYMQRCLGGYLSGKRERTLKIPAYIYDKDNKAGLTKL